MEKEKKLCIYSITDLRTNEIVYVGKTNNFKNRLHQHFTEDKQPIDKYMLEQDRHNFEMAKLIDDIETNDEAVRLEDDYIVQLKPLMNKNRSGYITKDDPAEYNRVQKREYYEKWKNSDKHTASLEKKREQYNSELKYDEEYMQAQREKNLKNYYKNIEKRRDYQREYARAKRAALKLEKQKQDGLF